MSKSHTLGTVFQKQPNRFALRNHQTSDWQNFSGVIHQFSAAFCFHMGGDLWHLLVVSLPWLPVFLPQSFGLVILPIRGRLYKSRTFWHQEHGLHPTSPLWEGVTKMMIRTLGWSALLFLFMADFGETKVNHVFFQFPNFPEFPPGKKRQISPKLQKNPGIHWTGTFQRGACKPRWKSSLCR